MTKITSAWLTRSGLHLLTYSDGGPKIASWHTEDLEAQCDRADLAMNAEGYRRTTPWVYCPIKSDGMRCDVVARMHLVLRRHADFIECSCGHLAVNDADMTQHLRVVEGNAHWQAHVAQIAKDQFDQEYLNG